MYIKNGSKNRTGVNVHEDNKVVPVFACPKAQPRCLVLAIQYIPEPVLRLTTEVVFSLLLFCSWLMYMCMCMYQQNSYGMRQKKLVIPLCWDSVSPVPSAIIQVYWWDAVSTQRYVKFCTNIAKYFHWQGGRFAIKYIPGPSLWLTAEVEFSLLLTYSTSWHNFATYSTRQKFVNTLLP